jgi:hypothetical protein
MKTKKNLQKDKSIKFLKVEELLKIRGGDGGTQKDVWPN